MLTLATLVTVVSLLITMRVGRGDDGRLLPLPAIKGRVARAAIGLLVVLLIVLLTKLADKEGGHSTAFWMRALAIGSFILFINFIRGKDIRS